MAARHTASDYAGAFAALLPRGRAWPRDADALLTRILGALARAYERTDDRAQALLLDAFPATATGLLPEWEASLGLPDPCSGPADGLDARRAQAVAKLALRGGQSVAYMRAAAARLGYDVEIEQFAPARAGVLRAGEPARGTAWAFAWRVTAASQTVRRFRAGGGAAGDRLAVWGNAPLECTLSRVKPAHTEVIFAYADAAL